METRQAYRETLLSRRERIRQDQRRNALSAPSWCSLYLYVHFSLEVWLSALRVTKLTNKLVFRLLPFSTRRFTGQIVTLSAYLNSSYSTNGHFALQLSSPLILYLALLGFVQSVVIQTRYDVLLRSFPYTPPPLDGWSMSKLLRLRQQRAQSKRINLVSLSAIFLFLLAPVTATIALCKSWNRLQEVAKDVKRYTEDLEKTRSRIGLGLLSIERAKELLEHAKVVKTAKIWAGFWLAMLLIVVVVSPLAPTDDQRIQC